MKKHAVGLLILTDLPDGRRVAVLQVRGTFNPETMKSESWPGGCQVTCHGGLKPKEEEQDALWREAQEELGAPCTLLLQKQRKELRELYRFSAPNKEVATFGLLVEDPSFLKEIQLNAATGGIRLADATTSIASIPDFPKDEGVTDHRIIAMFSDEADALKKAFEIFSK